MNASFSRFAQSKENVLKLFNNINDGLMITNINREIIAVNQAFTKMTGYTIEEAEGNNLRFLQSELTKRAAFIDMWKTIEQFGTWTGEVTYRRKDETTFSAYVTMTKIDHTNPEECYYIGVMRDITTRKLDEKKLQNLSYYDSLTQLPNRDVFLQELTKALAESEAKDELLALLFVDMDRFKKVNDSYGHQAGDELLIKMANRIQNIVEDKGLLSRFGGDEFTVYLPQLKDKAMVDNVVTQILEAFRIPFMVEGNAIYMTLSIGVCYFPEHGEDADTLLKNADSAMYRTKDAGRNHYQVYEQNMNEKTAEQLTFEGEFLQALHTDQLEVYYQLQVDVDAGIPFGVEALVRWNHPTLGVISPGLFLPVAEETGKMAELDEWVLNQACLQTKQWQEEGFQGLIVSVNVSAAFFKRKDFVSRVEAALALSQLEPKYICLEVTENTAILQIEDIQNKLWQLKNKGMCVSLDDFGTGYSSLSQLRYFPIDTLKIDQSFVRDSKAKENEAIVKLIIAMAKSLGVTVLCEGVETEEQLGLIRNEGCNHAQGFLFSKPLPSAQCQDLLQKIKKSS
ncbi:putative bifunctional diguanylate cyclase/phosphodiesterase [Halalkalibacter urbisdiaboli]|uniref:putative bifunctional diguanylate cyclase/phosphodiesterase n=1 Tax=Halalkalibacter urbisdiaboli TaxID=1960589 RepID=UPI000B43F742|nr:GGDEF and EAL domain-containing protein [Halalkalibacter urbisdiaboli]